MLPKHKFSLLLQKKIPHILLPLSSRPVVSDLCDNMDRSAAGFPVLHDILEFAQSYPWSQ